jgi:hypothetical protein
MGRSRAGFGKHVRRDPIPFLWALLASAGVVSKAAALTTAESSFILPEIMWHPSHEYVVLRCGSWVAAMLNAVGNHIDLFLG